MKSIDKPLKYDANHIIGVHGLSRNRKSKILDKILLVKGQIDIETEKALNIHRENLDIFGEYWNEEEL